MSSSEENSGEKRPSKKRKAPENSSESDSEKDTQAKGAEGCSDHQSKKKQSKIGLVFKNIKRRLSALSPLKSDKKRTCRSESDLGGAEHLINLPTVQAPQTIGKARKLLNALKEQFGDHPLLDALQYRQSDPSIASALTSDINIGSSVADSQDGLSSLEEDAPGPSDQKRAVPTEEHSLHMNPMQTALPRLDDAPTNIEEDTQESDVDDSEDAASKKDLPACKDEDKET